MRNLSVYHSLRLDSAGFSAGLLTFLSSLLAGAVDVVFELDADLALGGLVPDEGVLEQLLRGRAAGVRLDQAALDEVDELLGPGRKGQVRG